MLAHTLSHFSWFFVLVFFFCLVGVGGVCSFDFLGKDLLWDAFLGFGSYELVFFGTLLIVCLMIFSFSWDYLSSEPRDLHFMFMLVGFSVSMMVLIFSNSLLMLFLGWEGLGVTSYFLVMYYRSMYALSVASKVILMNRVGDVCFIFCIFLVFMNLGWESLSLFMIFLAAFTKSAIFPFSSWLPAAMGAPTPVSALVHSSTLVTAGLWLLLKFSCGGVVAFAVFGGVTMFLGGLFALIEKDIKKVVAFSTLSQLGLILLSMSIFGKDVAFTHLIVHAFVKASLFVVVGYGILVSFHNQSEKSFFSSMSPIFFFFMSCSLMSLSGVVFFSGFHSKHLMYTSNLETSLFVSFVWFIGVTMTAIYSWRLLLCVKSGGVFKFSFGSCWAIFPLSFFGVVSGEIIPIEIFWVSQFGFFVLSWVFFFGLVWEFFSGLEVKGEGLLSFQNMFVSKFSIFFSGLSKYSSSAVNFWFSESLIVSQSSPVRFFGSIEILVVPKLVVVFFLLFLVGVFI